MEFKKAKSCLESAVYLLQDELEQRDLAENPELFETLSTLGKVCFELGEVEQAVEYFDKATQVLEKKYNGVETNMEFARSYRDRAYVYESLGEYKKSLSFYEQDLCVKLAVFGEKPPGIYIVESFNGIARAYRKMNNLDQAIIFFKKALEIIEEVGKTRLASHYCIILVNLLSVYSENGDIDKAFDGYRDLFETVAKLFGNGVLHPYLASSLGRIRASCDALQAIVIYERTAAWQK